ncbi:MAG: hypothetical protein IJ660_03945 [Alphaproteobacteria bacterium]|nr:hypothetical protein [Alphaproteobacteria bacterium]
MNRICYSSEIYGLAVEDLISLPDSSVLPKNVPDDEVILLIGKRRLWYPDYPVTPDTLLKGRDAVKKAITAGDAYIPVRIAFENRIKAYDFISPLIRKLRYKYNLFSSNIYHIRPQEIREKGLERNLRTSANAYKFSNPKYQMSEAERQQTYEKLVKSMQEKGYDDRCPLDIMLCRNMGIKDTLNQGHHRMSVALECGIDRVSVEFCAAGQAPRFLHPLCRVIADFNLFIKHLLSR